MRFKDGKYGGWIYHSEVLSPSDMVHFPAWRLYTQIEYKGYSGTLSLTHTDNTSTSLLAVRIINCMLVHSQSDLAL